jgi:hypothetical protein
MDLAEYIQNNYGECLMVSAGKSCACIKHGWIGKGCHSWKPYEASTWEEVREIQCGNTGAKPSELKLSTITEKPTESHSFEQDGSSSTQ